MSVETSLSYLKLNHYFFESVMLSNHLILYRPLLLTNSMHMSLSQLRETVNDREALALHSMGSQSQTRLSD